MSKYSGSYAKTPFIYAKTSSRHFYQSMIIMRIKNKATKSMNLLVIS